MTPRRARPLLATAAALATLLTAAAAGCTSHVSAATAAAAAAKPGTAAPSAPATDARQPDPKASAEQDAASLLAHFTAPPGAVKSATQPPGTPAQLAGSSFRPGADTLISLSGWWVDDEPAADVESWLRQHGADGYGTIGGSPSFPVAFFPEPSTLAHPYRQVQVETGSLSPNRSVLHVVVDVVYRPLRPAGSYVPATSVLAVVARDRDGKTRSLTVTDPAKITKIRGLINQLPAAVREFRSCPFDSGAGLTLSFQDPAGTPRATVTINAEGCGTVIATVGAVRQQLDPSVDKAKGGFYGDVASVLRL